MQFIYLLPRHKMDSKTTCDLCKQCYNFLIEIKDIEVGRKIEKYLQLKMKYTPSGICINCYKSLNEFHEFYEKIHSAQENFQKITAVQSTTVENEVNVNEKTDCKENFPETNSVGTVIKNTVEINKIEDQTETCENEEKVCLEKSDVSVEKNDKKLKHSKFKEISSEMEKKMLEFYNTKCEKCDYGKFTSFKMLSKHYVTVHNVQGYIKCCKRNIRVNDKYYLRSHMYKHLQPETCRCRVCGKELSSLATLKHHMILHRPTEERPFHCGECGKGFCCKNDLKNHEKAIHVPENKKVDYICDVCGKVFQKVANLRYHHSTVHLQERKYICEVCAKCFTTQSGLRTHINAAHTILDPIQCQECNKWLKTKDTFQKHLQLHKNNTYPCTHCDKVCNSSASLRSHLVKHSEERPYSCGICKKSFKTKTHLKNHSTQHVGGSNYKCPYCPKLFVNMSNFYTHRRRIHSAEAAKKQESKSEAKISQQLCNRENTVIYDYKIVKTDDYNTSLPEVSTVRQNIIISPVKY